ncbi:hypothetical protein FA95DRAFT_1572955 [Auriscalpium vulgare]|uniref:Uncharacterized protein n=1 Tax=Auriscalpium vulgare TaxID=40419 RepID=A0ACB8RRM3_9AGAM|nr:hypothetical protein FA95DRAFT_1572955 [Auriscalpium vulgare]
MLSSESVESDTIWLQAARSAICTLEPVPRYPPSTTYTTFEDVAAAERVVAAARDARRAQLQAEEDAIERAKQELRDAFAAGVEYMTAALCALRQQHNDLDRIDPHLDPWATQAAAFTTFVSACCSI